MSLKNKGFRGYRWNFSK